MDAVHLKLIIICLLRAVIFTLISIVISKTIFFSAKEGAKPAVNKQVSNTFIDICFHAIISPTILNPQKDYVVLAFEKYGGGWNDQKYKLQLERY